MIRSFSEFDEIWCVDFEFYAPDGERAVPLCLVARELRTSRHFRTWRDELSQLSEPPYRTGDDSLFVAYYASAEMGCHLALNWPLPEYVLDLFAEFRVCTNGLNPLSGNGLVGALAYFGIDSIGALEKSEMRQLALRGGPWTPAERIALLNYCESDVVALVKLLEKLEPRIDVARALLRGRYMKAAARMEWTGVPIDTELLKVLRDARPDLQGQLIACVDAHYHVFDGRTFKVGLWENWLAAHNILWPRLPTGKLCLDDVTFKKMAIAYPEVAPIRELRESIAQIRSENLSVGSDARNRCLLSAFRAKTGRNQPSSTEFIFGLPAWMRNLIRPEPGYGLAYIDWSQQEFGIAAALSGDLQMLNAYVSGDPYLAFAKQAGAVPPDATKTSHPAIRELYKACALAVQYGIGADSLAMRIGKPPHAARELLNTHQRTYRKFWRWSDAAVNHAYLLNRLYSVFGWSVHVINSNINARSLRNFPMQANGAEMLRLACCLATERGIHVCAPIHDALLIEAPVDQLEKAVEITQTSMAEASVGVLGGFKLRSEAKLVRYPEHFHDDRGKKTWVTVWKLIGNRIPESMGSYHAGEAA
jgi:DNA polymerase family A